MENVNEANESEERYFTLADTRQTLQKKLEETDDPKMIEAIGKAIAAINDTDTNEQNVSEKLALMADDLELKKQELEKNLELQEKQMGIQEKQIKVTKLAAVLGIVGTAITAGFKVFGIYQQGQQAIQFQREGYAEEKCDEPVAYKSNKHMIPNVFSKNVN